MEIWRRANVDAVDPILKQDRRIGAEPGDTPAGGEFPGSGFPPADHGGDGDAAGAERFSMGVGN